MRCKKHLSDLSSSIGVCATCLRQRLFSLLEAQSIPNSISENPNPNNNHQSISSLHHHHHQEQPPPLIFPRSVSPYITRRKSDQPDNKPIIQRFYSTPQVDPTQKKKKNSRFSLISKLFRSKSSVASSTSAASSDSVGPTRRCNRGMSPQGDDVGSTRPSPGRVKQSPARTANNVASLAFCLSPLVRASPASRHHWGIEPTFSGEIRVPATGKVNGLNSHSNSVSSINNKNCDKPHLGDAASFCANRSRKIADFGRLNRKR
ncbi:Protein CFT1 [Bienertia sinuspersici]